MADPSPSASASAAPTMGGAPSAPAPTATEIVHRPDPGLARGRWEAPTWAFYVIGAVALLFALVYLGFRVGLFESKKR